MPYYDVHDIAEIITEDPSVINEFILAQFEEFWKTLAQDRDFAKIAQAQDFNALLDAVGPDGVKTLVDWAEQNDWPQVAQHLQRQSGNQTQERGPWVGTGRAVGGGPDY